MKRKEAQVPALSPFGKHPSMKMCHLYGSASAEPPHNNSHKQHCTYTTTATSNTVHKVALHNKKQKQTKIKVSGRLVDQQQQQQ
jgi:hypothetical protein